MRIRWVLGVLTLPVLSSGCALPCVALHNVRVELRDNLEEHLAGVREWWHGSPGGLTPCPGERVQQMEPMWPPDSRGGGVAEKPAALPPPPDWGNERFQAGGR